jgi:hypothetical protein
MILPFEDIVYNFISMCLGRIMNIVWADHMGACTGNLNISLLTLDSRFLKSLITRVQVYQCVYITLSHQMVQKIQ